MLSAAPTIEMNFITVYMSTWTLPATFTLTTMPWFSSRVSPSNLLMLNFILSTWHLLQEVLYVEPA